MDHRTIKQFRCCVSNSTIKPVYVWKLGVIPVSSLLWALCIICLYMRSSFVERPVTRAHDSPGAGGRRARRCCPRGSGPPPRCSSSGSGLSSTAGRASKPRCSHLQHEAQTRSRYSVNTDISIHMVQLVFSQAQKLHLYTAKASFLILPPGLRSLAVIFQSMKSILDLKCSKPLRRCSGWTVGGQSTGIWHQRPEFVSYGLGVVGLRLEKRWWFWLNILDIKAKASCLVWPLTFPSLRYYLKPTAFICLNITMNVLMML